MTLKVILAGFSPQSAGALNVLLQRNYPNTECVVLDRCFGDDLRLMLPLLSSENSDAHATIINLDGVGMSLVNKKHIKNLVNFIDFRISLLLTRGDIEQWQHAEFLPNTTGFFLKAPYNKDTMEAALTKFMEAAQRLKDIPMEATKNRGMIRAKAAKHLDKDISFADIRADLNKTIIPDSDSEFIQNLVRNCFANACPNNVIYELVEIFSQKEPFKVTISNQEIYVYPDKSIVLANNLERTLDYFSIVGNCQVLKAKISSTPIPINDQADDEFINDLRHEGYRRYSLNSFLWQIYSEILPLRVNTRKNNLKLKIRYMPNFAGMKKVPEYVHAVVSSCLIVPKNIIQLQEVFGDVIKHDVALLQRIFLLSILSGSADLDVLKNSYKANFEISTVASTPATESVETPKAETPAANEGVKKAAKTGFFKRLLSKLSF